MEALVSQIFSVGFGIIVPFIFVLTIVVFFHELGHFYVARRCGVTVECFPSVSVGRWQAGTTNTAHNGKSDGCRWAVT